MNFAAAVVDSSGRLRSGWRFAVFLAAYFLAVTLFAGFGAAVLSIIPAERRPGTSAYFVLNSVLSLIPALLVGWLCGKLLEGLPFRALGAAFSAGWFRHLTAGLLIGGISIGLAVLIAVAFGGLGLRFDSEFSAQEIFESSAKALIVFAAAAAFEEALFRGYILQTFARSGLAWLAIGMTAGFFGVVHLGNPNAGFLSTSNTALAGIWFGVAYLKSRDLWFPFGMHLIWNWLQGAVFGIEVSGLTDLAGSPLLREIDRGPEWLTGGDYGIEAGIACTVALVASTLFIYFAPILKPSKEMLVLTSAAEASLEKEKQSTV